MGGYVVVVVEIVCEVFFVGSVGGRWGGGEKVGASLVTSQPCLQKLVYKS